MKAKPAKETLAHTGYHTKKERGTLVGASQG
jgi:hypothetical protein